MPSQRLIPETGGVPENENEIEEEKDHEELDTPDVPSVPIPGPQDVRPKKSKLLAKDKPKKSKKKKLNLVKDFKVDCAKEGLPANDGRDLKAIAKSLDHLMTHSEKNPHCPECMRAKMQKAGAYTNKSGHPECKKFGDSVTGDHFVTEDILDAGCDGEKCGLVLKHKRHDCV